MATKNDNISLLKTLMLIFMQKIKFILRFFLETLLTCYELVILGTLGMADHAHQKQQNQLKKIFNII